MISKTHASPIVLVVSPLLMKHCRSPGFLAERGERRKLAHQPQWQNTNKKPMRTPNSIIIFAFCSPQSYRLGRQLCPQVAGAWAFRLQRGMRHFLESPLSACLALNKCLCGLGTTERGRKEALVAFRSRGSLYSPKAVVGVVGDIPGHAVSRSSSL